MTRELSAAEQATLTWFKSTYSDQSNGPECVEVAWIKSTYSASDSNECVEVASSPACASVHIRDSKNIQRGMLNLKPDAWSAFVAHVAGG
ncbi:hypothetical protein SLNWT_1854 [Streptomyces albus]|uniref:DUF397 domain-containing protein n=1 Tax=Streptomyces albus (strain ATCC 21838 / DSM 41398 / FERM P-419 / JCM 4703 / NBRC 107858) TaxID=1081613 RepID=A0A0B5ESI5_STRA4|nr:hypothetical protein SLNWT_1854 [Streptomyces albus]AOU76547.1 hypothetical protein SLNHY_1856 [Streptomyces albus]AYN32330.1 DUF397 domain-containing protein [Streptomyces albus]